MGFTWESLLPVLKIFSLGYFSGVGLWNISVLKCPIEQRISLSKSWGLEKQLLCELTMNWSSPSNSCGCVRALGCWRSPVLEPSYLLCGPQARKSSICLLSYHLLKSHPNVIFCLQKKKYSMYWWWVIYVTVVTWQTYTLKSFNCKWSLTYVMDIFLKPTSI